MTHATCADTSFGWTSRRRNRHALAVALGLTAILVVNGCGIFAIIFLVSQAMSLLNQMGVFGDGKLSKFIAIGAMVGTFVGAGGMIKEARADALSNVGKTAEPAQPCWSPKALEAFEQSGGTATASSASYLPEGAPPNAAF